MMQVYNRMASVYEKQGKFDDAIAMCIWLVFVLRYE